AQAVERVGQLTVGIESERVLALRPVQRDGGDAVFDAPAEMVGTDVSERDAIVHGALLQQRVCPSKPSLPWPLSPKGREGNAVPKGFCSSPSSPFGRGGPGW